MNSPKPLRLHSFLANPSAAPRVPSVGNLMRPLLTAIEVHDSSVGEWLAAGGVRRARPRAATTEADMSKRGHRTVTLGAKHRARDRSRGNSRAKSQIGAANRSAGDETHV